MSVRKYIKRRWTAARQKKLDELYIDEGGHTESPENPLNGGNKVCVMEALAYVTGQGVKDHPICVSGTITELMININDSGCANNNERQRLKELIPVIMGTRPIYRAGLFEYSDSNNPDYQKAENERLRIIGQFLVDHDVRNEVREIDLYGEDWWLHLSPEEPYNVGEFEDRLKLVEKLAKVKYFNR